MKKNGFYKFRLIPLCLSFLLLYATALWSAEPTVYVIGYETEYGEVLSWTNGSKKYLTGLPNEVYSFSIYNGKLYVMGCSKNKNPCYWIDGVIKEIQLEKSTEWVAIGGVFSTVISNGKLYAFGWTTGCVPEGCGPGSYSLWVDGVEKKRSEFSNYEITEAEEGPGINQFTVVNDKLYMTVSDYDSSWKKSVSYFVDGKKFKLSGTDVVTSDIAISSGKVYIAGRYKKAGYNRACFWADGKQVELAGGKASRATSISVSKGKVYVSGYYYDTANKACYWVNGVKKDLEGGTISGAVDDSAKLPITVYNDKVYIAGYYYEGKNKKACYWVDGKKVDLPGGVEAVAIEVQ